MANGNHEALDDQIALLRRQVADLTELATAASGSAQEENLASAINEKQDQLDELLKRREELG
ncbi:hypothetical protein [Bosea sp. BK604]|uniref:hypothetical protein n=1 Tax=Bosea sp. BK604 TaxID=2512180 RepID=UPI001046A981|nr:hypothetical protein [Bosea sp. BK604]TCR65530.1 hypothetical protein EV560_105293 [Bosea sp. BK604]